MYELKIPKPREINKKIVLDKHVSTIPKILKKAKEYLISKGCDHATTGFLYFIGPLVSDLVIIEVNKKPKAENPRVRKCTDKEWNSYFNKHIVPRNE